MAYYRASIGGGGVTPTSITPSNSSPVLLANGNVYEITNNGGYAIKTYSSKTPDDSTHPSVSLGDIVKMGGSGYLYKTVQGGGTLNSTVIDNNGSTFTSRSQYSVNVKNALPSVYNRLTLANFAVDGAIGLGSSTSAVQNDTALFLSYNASTGILSLGKRTTKVGSNTLNFTYKVRVFYVS